MAGAVPAAGLQCLAVNLVRSVGLKRLAESSDRGGLLRADAVAGSATKILAAGNDFDETRSSVREHAAKMVL